MGKLLDVSFDIFFSILELTDAESLLAVGQCSRQCREWANDTLLWKEIVRRMQENGIQPPADRFTGIDRMPIEQLKRCALRACRIRRKWSSEESYPTKSIVVDCNPSRYQHGVFCTTQRIRWIIPITDDFFAVKLGYHMSSGFLQIWQRNVDAPRIVVHLRYDWITWGHCTDLAGKAWYFIFSEHNPNQFGHTIYIMKFTGFESDPERKLEPMVVAKYPTYGSIINVFILDVTRRAVCILYSGAPSGNITLFFVPDWLEKSSVHIDTGVKDDYLTKSTFICWMDTGKDQLLVQFEPTQMERAFQHVYSLHDLTRYMDPVPAFPFPLPSPPCLKPNQVFDLTIVDTPPGQVSHHKLKSIVSFDHHYFPIFPRASDTCVPPICSHISFASSFGRDLNPIYVFKHVHVGLAGARPFIRRVVAPAVCRMAFEQDYMESNTSRRFPIGHALDLRGHELVALGHACAAWVEARPGLNPDIILDFDQEEYDLKLVLFPWNAEEGEPGGMSRSSAGLNNDTVISVCTIKCPPEVDLAKVTGLWLDAVQGRIFIGMKWGKFIVLDFS
ncbi:hypothetical protein ACEPAG_1356 [Sanghuangporus baumii]